MSTQHGSFEALLDLVRAKAFGGGIDNLSDRELSLYLTNHTTHILGEKLDKLIDVVEAKNPGLNGNPGNWRGRAAKAAPPTGVGIGIGAVVIEVLRVLAG